MMCHQLFASPHQSETYSVLHCYTIVLHTFYCRFDAHPLRTRSLCQEATTIPTTARRTEHTSSTFRSDTRHRQCTHTNSVRQPAGPDRAVQHCNAVQKLARLGYYNSRKPSGALTVHVIRKHIHINVKTHSHKRTDVCIDIHMYVYITCMRVFVAHAPATATTAAQRETQAKRKHIARKNTKQRKAKRERIASSSP